MFELPRQAVTVIVPRSPPSAESDRLLLRPISEADLQSIFAIRSRPEVAKFNHPKTPFQSLEDAREWLSSKTFVTGPSEVIGCSFTMAVVDKSIASAKEQVIGYVGINTLDPCPQVGYSILPECWGKGYATEALQMMLKMWWNIPRREMPSLFAREEEPEKVYALCEKANHGSCQVLRKCNFEVVDEIRYEMDELYCWALTMPASY
ncbi:Acyl-CoA N-acyltransferase [Penicillium hetheringtonii]|uniref:Acyl-CoA N-acyltransferase n=1 Tax=Penicillium hetheringtonii TaxID=911720 RepID=A0AAD6DKZ9_9EURO|nr:Acyl-CoA N-acyltransferase [Penicillium hetheringtonii]